ncbi:MAG: hypothetical protein ABH886_10630 [Candidatus Desantisbacteria bacterium]
MRIAFHSNQLCERGTEVALYDYAHFNEVLLKNDSIVFARKGNKNNKAQIIEKFRNRFKVYLYQDIKELEQLLKKESIDVFYAIKSGENDSIVSKHCKTVVHCVFTTLEPHGNVYGCISNSLNKRFNTNCPVVPHMVYLPDIQGDLRNRLGIPKNAVVFGSYGAYDNFNIEFVHKAIKKLVCSRKDIYFIFMNIRSFYKSWFGQSNKQLIHLPFSVNLEDKVRFINTCNAMIHARIDGETFGLSIAEFSIKNKPVITYKPLHKEKICYNDAHLEILGDKAIIYSAEDELFSILNNYNPECSRQKFVSVYSSDYNPEAVMHLFESFFLKDADK